MFINFTQSDRLTVISNDHSEEVWIHLAHAKNEGKPFVHFRLITWNTDNLLTIYDRTTHHNASTTGMGGHFPTVPIMRATPPGISRHAADHTSPVAGKCR